MVMEFESPKAMSEILEWHDPAEQFPDAHTTVLLIVAEDMETHVGYYDGTIWCDDVGTMHGFPIMDDVLFWAHMPEGPEQ